MFLLRYPSQFNLSPDGPRLSDRSRGREVRRFTFAPFRIEKYLRIKVVSNVRLDIVFN